MNTQGSSIFFLKFFVLSQFIKGPDGPEDEFIPKNSHRNSIKRELETY